MSNILRAPLGPYGHELVYDVENGTLIVVDGGAEILETYIGNRDRKMYTILDIGTRADCFNYINNRLDRIKCPGGNIIDSNECVDAFNDLKHQFKDLLETLNDPEALAEASEAEKEQLEAEQREHHLKLAQEANEYWNEIDSPIMHISNELEWISAGEKMGILYSWLAYASQIILRQPISVIGIGEASSGKSHIQEISLGMIPEEFVYTVKSITEAVFYGKASFDPYFFDGKIVNIGDMGGKDDHKESQDFKNAMKEMQTDGYCRREKMVPQQDGTQLEQVYELFGYPCLTYTNVPGYAYEDQEKSRSIFVTSRVDNKEAVGVFKQYNRQKFSKMRSKIDKHRELLNTVQGLVMALRIRMEDVEIYNPYYSFIEDFLGNNKNYKRDVDTYDAILRIITAINGYNRELFDIDGNKVLFSTPADIKIFLQVTKQYIQSIRVSVAPGAIEVYNRLLSNGNIDPENALSSTEYMSTFRPDIAEKSIGTYMSDLKAAGLLGVGDEKDGRKSRYYVLNTITEEEDISIKLNSEDIQMLLDNYELTDVRDYETKDTDIKLLDITGDKPPWFYKLPEVIFKQQKKEESAQGGFF